MPRKPSINLNRESGIPLYIQVANWIREYIGEKGLETGDRLPSEKELQERFSVSRATIRQAFDKLARGGVIKKEQGKGTFIHFPKFKRELTDLIGFSEQMLAEKCAPGSKLLSCQKERSENICKQFSKNEGEILKVIRLRLADEVPIGIHYTFIPKTLADELNFPDKSLEPGENESLYLKLKEHGYRLDHAFEIISAKGATDFESKHLNIEKGVPVLFIHKKTFSGAKDLLEIVEAVYRPDRYEYNIQLGRNLET